MMQLSAAEKLEFEIYKAIHNRAIRGVEVSVRDGTAYLTGRVATERQKLAAAQAARGVPGVKEVRDQVIINSAPIARMIGQDESIAVTIVWTDLTFRSG